MKFSEIGGQGTFSRPAGRTPRGRSVGTVPSESILFLKIRYYLARCHASRSRPQIALVESHFRIRSCRSRAIPWREGYQATPRSWADRHTSQRKIHQLSAEPDE